MEVRCSWVPNTMDQVNVVSQTRTAVFKLQEIAQYIGNAAVWDLYLKGRASVKASRALEAKLGLLAS